MFGFLDLGILGFVYSGSLGLWISGHPGTVFPCTVAARVG